VSKRTKREKEIGRDDDKMNIRKGVGEKGGEGLIKGRKEVGKNWG